MTKPTKAQPSIDEPKYVNKRKRSPHTRRILQIFGFSAAIVIVGWITEYQLIGKYFQSTDDAYVQADSVAVSPRVSGYVNQIFVRDNQRVGVGDPLVGIDPRDYAAQVAQYSAQIDVAAANADSTRAALGEQEAAIAQAQAQVDSAESDARFAAAQVVRYEPLAKIGAETGEKLTQLHDQAAKSAATLAAQKASLLQAQRKVASLRAQLRQAEAQGEAAKAQHDAAKVNLDSTIVRAGIEGRIGDKSVQIGQYVQSGTRMMTIVPVERIYVTANFKETQIRRIRPGQPASVSVDALSGVLLKGHVDSIAPATGSQFSVLPPQNATGNFTKIVQRVPVRIVINVDDEVRQILVPGLSVIAEVDTTKIDVPNPVAELPLVKEDVR